MIKLSSKERLTRLFNCQEIDRVPIWLLFPYHRLGCYTDVYNNPVYKPLLPYIEEYCDTFDRRSYTYGDFCRNGNPEIIKRSLKEEINSVMTDVFEVSYKDLKFRRFVETTDQGKRNRYLLSEPEQLEQILNIPYVPPSIDFSKYRQEKDELGDKGLMMMDLGDPLVALYFLMSAEDFSIWTITDYDRILAFTDEMYHRFYDVYKRYLDDNVGDVFFICGAEFAGPPMAAPSKFNELSARYVKGIVDLIRNYGKHSIIHYHGNLYHVLDGMKDVNPDGLHTIEAPPIGDCTITQARAKLNDMILIGNIQYDDLRRLPSGEIEEMVRLAVQEGKTGRFILSPTAGPYEDEIPELMINNYITMIEAGIKYGGLS